jgi:hypothetical protein
MIILFIDMLFSFRWVPGGEGFGLGAEQAMDVPEVNDNDKAVLQKWL